ncbi:SusD/RagB family nutrient-binding outer membrane lipoprotein [Carboxylicivirga sp. A043]|uniref:SusD/RagB family nutrient-binding outer membrane lipoprotein n=1 Tax=Carboxylicivirga litoralis TaxID=2816963 RepID=UPI0021CB547B|nr:SusD/RagB family nutrient-binding outer membrane lipoprotein [Carboxylicivirga sp. A043]MCU4154660.1 SusD/RagB family nutrient-binding outer membrane lipoprotein [Carboxylicivirga sp. A043]
MKHTIKFFSFLLAIATLSSCLDFEELRENPNEPNSVPPGLLFTALVPGATSSFSNAYMHAQYHVRADTDYGDFSYRYGSSSFKYNSLKDINKMEEEAVTANAPAYLIMAKFLRAVYYISMTRDMGDIPMSEAVQAEDGIYRPKYDSQKEVYLQCLTWLNEASIELGDFILENPSFTLSGDYYFDGDLRAWQKVINTFTLRTLISLSIKADDADLDVKGRFANIINNPADYPLMEGLEDNMQIEHWDEDGFRGIYNPNNSQYLNIIVYADTYIELLKNYQDPRLFEIADPTPEAVAANPEDPEGVRMDFDSYAGCDISDPVNTNAVKRAEGKVSKPNAARFNNFIGQPSIYIGYAEQELLIAEAAQRGWIPADAETHYNNGVRASMNFYNVASSDINDYLSGFGAYEDDLTKILEQQYIALAENSGWEAFFLNRRTGVPTYKLSETNQVEQLPVRWMYPISENQDNYENYRAALVAQFGSEVDSRDGVMWILQD